MEEFTNALVGTLCQTFSSDTVTIRAATSTLKSQFFNKPESLTSLLQISMNHSEWQVRQLAAVEARKKVPAYWTRLHSSERKQIKSDLMSRILCEEHALTRHSLARVVSSIAQVDVPNHHWPELMPLLDQFCCSGVAEHRQVGVYVLYSLCDVIADYLEDHVCGLLGVFARLISDPESYQVRVITLEALGKMLELIDPEEQVLVNQFRQLLPQMVSVLQESIEQSDEASASKGFQVFEELLLCELPILNTHLSELTQFFLKLASNVQLDEGMRVMALSCVMWIVMYQKSKIVKLKLIEPMVQVLFPIAAETEAEEAEESENTPVQVALQVLNAMGTHLAPQHIFPLMAKYSREYMDCGDASYKKAALLGMCVMVDGCADYMRTHLPEILGFVARGLQDATPTVVKAACMTLGSLAEEMPDVCATHAQLFPLLSPLLHHPSEDVQKQAISCLDTLLEGMDEAVVPYLDGLLTTLAALLDRAPAALKAGVLGAIGSAAHAAQSEFTPYFPVLAQKCHEFMRFTDADLLLLRGMATDALSTMAEAVGKDVFGPYLAHSMTLVLQALQMQNEMLHECSFLFCAAMARLFPDEFGEYLCIIVPKLILSCEKESTSESIGENISENTEIISENISENTENITENTDIISENTENTENINSAITAEKETAANVLGSLFQAMPVLFAPYLRETLACLLQLTIHENENVRQAAIGSLFQYVSTVYMMSENESSSSDGSSSSNSNICTSNTTSNTTNTSNISTSNIFNLSTTTTIIQLVMEACLAMLKEEGDRLMVVHLLQEIAAAVKSVPILLSQHRNRLLQEILDIFQFAHPCQDPCQDAEMAEHEVLLINAAADVIAAVACSEGASFAATFADFFPFLSKLASSKASAERSLAVGSLAEIIVGLRNGIANYTQPLLVLLSAAISDSDEEVKSNAAFAIGALCEHSPLDLTPHYLAFMHALHPLFLRNALPNMVDNACGAIARMMKRAPLALPLEHVVPVLLQYLPLRIDFEEYDPVFDSLISLISNPDLTTSVNLTQFASVTAQVFLEKHILKENTKQNIVNLFASMNLNHASAFEQLLLSLQPEEAQMIKTLI